MGRAARNRHHYSLEEYLAFERSANVKHEYLDGEILAMTGATPEHNRICASVIALLSNRLAGRPCVVFTSDQRVRITGVNVETYPDVSVVCGKLKRHPQDRLALANPVLLVEVTSPSTASYDRGEKLDYYKRLPSLREVVIVSHSSRRVDVVRRERVGRWASESFTRGDSVVLASLDCELPIDAIYHDPLAGA